MSAAARTLALAGPCDSSEDAAYERLARCDGRILAAAWSAPLQLPAVHTYQCQRQHQNGKRRCVVVMR